jgi:hypothetical protein
MTEGRLSSALVKKFQLKESVGTVLWHSLDRNGYIGEYDMQFGDVVLEGIHPSYIRPIHEQEHAHPPQEKDD